MDWSLTRIGKNIDFDADGLQLGELRVPPTTQNVPPGYISVPVAVVRNGEGPTVLLTAGNHGDEYEGPIALLKLVGSIDPAELRGRIIAIPYLNAPAVAAAQRCSPVDGANLNRLFPGDRNGGPSQMIAHLVEAVLLPGCALALDFHSGGRVAYYGSCTLVYRPQDEALYRANLDYAEAFGAPLAYLLSTMSDDRTFPVAAARQRVPSISTELGGLSILTASALRLAEAGLRRVLKRAGVMPAIAVEPAPATRFVGVTSYDNNVYAPVGGLFEARFEIGDEVRAGDVAGYIYSLDEPFAPPRELTFGTSGIVLVKQGPTLVEKGTRLSVVATPSEP